MMRVGRDASLHRSDEGAGPGEPMSERNVQAPPELAGLMWRGSRPTPPKRPGCHVGTIYGGPVRLQAGR
jgi:hypothetical protein